MDVLLWIVIGFGGGASIIALMPESGQISLREKGWRRVAGTVAGGFGAMLGGYGLVFISRAVDRDALRASTPLGAQADKTPSAAVR